MSTYKVLKCAATKQSQVVAGLIAVGFNEKDIRTYPSPVAIQGWGSQTAQADVVIEREALQHLGGYSYGDIGFEQQNGEYRIHLDSSSERWWKSQQGKFQQGISESKITEEAEARGYTVSRVQDGKSIRLKLTRSW